MAAVVQRDASFPNTCPDSHPLPLSWVWVPAWKRDLGEAATHRRPFRKTKSFPEGVPKEMPDTCCGGSKPKDPNDLICMGVCWRRSSPARLPTPWRVSQGHCPAPLHLHVLSCSETHHPQDPLPKEILWPEEESEPRL